MSKGLDKYSFDPIFSDKNEDFDEEGGVSLATKKKVKRPKLYKVLLHNDDYTTMEFVIHILQKHFGKTIAEAQAIMLKVHNEGAGICGVYTCEIAETKVSKVSQEAKDSGHPLLCTHEPE